MKYMIKLRPKLNYVDRKLSNGTMIDTLEWTEIPKALFEELRARDMKRAATPKNERRAGPEFEFKTHKGDKKNV